MKLSLLIPLLFFTTYSQANPVIRCGKQMQVAEVSFADLWQTNLKQPKLSSRHVLVVDKFHNPLIEKQAEMQQPIASITKLMTALVVLRSGLPLNVSISIEKEDIDRLKNSSSRLKVGETFSRLELLRLALMSSDNRAAHALARTYPNGVKGFVKAMNFTAEQLGLYNTFFADPTGLNPKNVSSAKDVASLLHWTDIHPLIRQLTTAQEYQLKSKKRATRQYVNTNRQLRYNNTQYSVSKTGFINESGYCLATRMDIANQQIDIVLLNADSQQHLFNDLSKIRRWVEKNVCMD